MRQKKSIPETEQPALALHPAGARPPAEVAQVSPYSFDMEEQKEPAVNRTARSHRFVWFLGIILLVGTALGAAWALNHGSTDMAPTSGSEAFDPPGVVALGMVDNDPKIRQLRPLMGGEVIEVAAEGKRVKKGDVLLRIDSEIAALAVTEAEAFLQNALVRLEQAKTLPEKHKLELQSQEKAITIAQKKTNVARHEVEANRKESIVSKAVMEAAEDGLKALEALADVEKNKLSVLKLVKPEQEIARAQSDVDGRKALLAKARRALSKHALPAPEDGTVLRVFVNPGEMFAPDAKLPAIQFCPDGKRIIRAEVLQEWAGLVDKGQKVAIEDEARGGSRWNGTVSHVSDWITQKREVMLEPFMVNDVRTLECLIEVAPGGPPLRIGQRVRVIIQQAK
jgi:multidrug resistance efflux pump